MKERSVNDIFQELWEAKHKALAPSPLEQAVINYEDKVNRGQVLPDVRDSLKLPPNRPEHRAIDRVQATILRVALAGRKKVRTVLGHEEYDRFWQEIADNDPSKGHRKYTD